MVPIYPHSSLLTYKPLTVKAVKAGFPLKEIAVRDTCILLSEMEISEYTYK